MFVYIAIGVLVAFMAWRFIAPEPQAESLLTTESMETGSVDSTLVDTLLTLRAVSLSGTIFSEPAFAALQDFGTQIVAEPVGRENPFAPISFRATSTPRTSQLFGPQRR